MNQEQEFKTAVSITLGDWVEIVIENDTFLKFVKKENGGVKTITEIDLGFATVEKIQLIQDSFERLKIHAMKKD